jgi:hypothetical protein
MRKRLVGLVPLLAAYVLMLALGVPLWVAVVVLVPFIGVYWRVTWPPGFRERMTETWHHEQQRRHEKTRKPKK